MDSAPQLPPKRAVPPPPRGCPTEGDHQWRRTDEVSTWSEAVHLEWDLCDRCNKRRFVEVDTSQ